MPAHREGVIKFHLVFQPGPPPEEQLLHELNHWRSVFLRHALIGQDPNRYEGLGFGNLSRRLPQPGSEAFLITGTQTGHLKNLQPADYAIVLDCDPTGNTLQATGRVKPSSEALSHGVLYQCAPGIHWVMHLHSPEIFNDRVRLHLPATDPAAAYGTPEMAREISKLAGRAEPSKPGLVIMTGHQDGLLAYGPTAEATGRLVLETLHATRPL